MHRLVLPAVLLSFCGCSGTDSPSVSDKTAEAFVGWAREYAVPVEMEGRLGESIDLSVLEPTVARAAVVALGESRHDAREQFLLKNAVIKYLIEEHDFTTVALEESFAHAELINRFVVRGEGDLDRLMNRMGAWFIWDTEEIRSMLTMLREHNEGQPPERRVRFAGLDITHPIREIEAVTGFLTKTDPGYLQAIDLRPELFDVTTWGQIVGAYAAAPPESLAAVQAAFAQLLADLEERDAQLRAASSEVDYVRTVRAAEILVAADTFFRHAAEGSLAEAGEIRERWMAGNARWHLEHSARRERMVIWAANFHVNKDSFDLSLPDQPTLLGANPMGKYLSESLDAEMVSIGMSFYEGESARGPIPPAEPGAIDACLAKVGPEIFFLDLSAAPVEGPVADWLGGKRVLRGQDNSAMLVPRSSFDAFFFTRSVTPCRPTPMARQKLQQLQ